MTFGDELYSSKPYFVISALLGVGP